MNRRTLIASLAGGLASLSVRTRHARAAGGPGAPGLLNLITDVVGLQVGQADDPRVRTGVTVILPDARAVCAVDVRGGGPGTRETDALDAWNLVRSADAIVLSGGSVYGLAAADGVATWLGARGRGYQAVPTPGVPRSPIVPAAILFDLANQGDKAWGMNPPYHDLGIRAVEAASRTIVLGTMGAGYGASSGALKGGIGSASLVTSDGFTVGAIVAVNSLGSPVVPGGRHFWSGPFELDKEFGGLGPSPDLVSGEDWGMAKINPGARTNHQHRLRGHRRRTGTGRGEARGDHGARRAGTGDPADPFAVRRRRGVRALDRPPAAAEPEARVPGRADRRSGGRRAGARGGARCVRRHPPARHAGQDVAHALRPAPDTQENEA